MILQVLEKDMTGRRVPQMKEKLQHELHPKRIFKGEWPYKQPRQQKPLVDFATQLQGKKPRARDYGNDLFSP